MDPIEIGIEQNVGFPSFWGSLASILGKTANIAGKAAGAAAEAYTVAEPYFKSLPTGRDAWPNMVPLDYTFPTLESYNQVTQNSNQLNLTRYQAPQFSNNPQDNPALQPPRVTAAQISAATLKPGLLQPLPNYRQSSKTQQSGKTSQNSKRFLEGGIKQSRSLNQSLQPSPIPHALPVDRATSQGWKYLDAIPYKKEQWVNPSIPSSLQPLNYQSGLLNGYSNVSDNAIFDFVAEYLKDQQASRLLIAENLKTLNQKIIDFRLKANPEFYGKAKELRDFSIALSKLEEGEKAGKHLTSVAILKYISAKAAILSNNNADTYIKLMDEVLIGDGSDNFSLITWGGAKNHPFAPNYLGLPVGILGKRIYLSDYGMHEIYRDYSDNQMSHFWAYVNYGYFQSKDFAKTLNMVHELVEPILFGQKSGSQQDYRLSALGYNIGNALKKGKIDPYKLTLILDEYLSTNKHDAVEQNDPTFKSLPIARKPEKKDK